MKLLVTAVLELSDLQGICQDLYRKGRGHVVEELLKTGKSLDSRPGAQISYEVVERVA